RTSLCASTPCAEPVGPGRCPARLETHLEVNPWPHGPGPRGAADVVGGTSPYRQHSPGCPALAPSACLARPAPCALVRGASGPAAGEDVAQLTAVRCPWLVRYVGRSHPLILAPRERHRQGTGVELSCALAVCVLTRRSTGGLGSLGAFPESH